jgi:hypothetical protein
MSEKNLLREGTIRRFMKLAGTQVLASDFLTEQGEGEELEAEAPDLGAGGEDLEMDFADVVEEEPPDEGEEPGEEEGSLEDAVRAMVDAIADVASDFGVDVEVGEEETAELEVPEFEGEAEETEAEEELELGAEEEDEDLALQEGTPDDAPAKKRLKTPWNQEMKDCVKSGKSSADCEKLHGKKTTQQESQELDEINYIDEDAVMNEVFHRVKSRLIQEKRTDDMASQLAERISRRLNKRN